MFRNLSSTAALVAVALAAFPLVMAYRRLFASVEYAAIEAGIVERVA
jgi:hypothetical protein